jgi:hypothetical protein
MYIVKNQDRSLVFTEVLRLGRIMDSYFNGSFDNTPNDESSAINGWFKVSGIYPKYRIPEICRFLSHLLMFKVRYNRNSLPHYQSLLDEVLN